VLGDKPYTFFRAFFWIGSRCLNHQGKVEKGMAMLDELVESYPNGAIKLRILLEYQYAESFEFFAIFNRVDRQESLHK